MMKRLGLTPLLVGILLVLFGLPSQWVQPAQTGDCAQVARSVMTAVQEVCDGLKRDHICYGNVSIEAQPAAGVSDLRFTQQGDTANIQDVGSLKLKSLDINSSEWGVALMKVKASLADDSAQNVTILLFGNVEVKNQGADLGNLPMTVRSAANVRLRPVASAPLVGSLPVNSDVVANGRMTNNVNELWVRIQFAAAPGGVGWVLAAALTAGKGDVNSLTAVTSTNDHLYGPMQAFTFTSGKDDSPCEEAPESGITIQTPKGKGQISLLINEVNVQIGSTAYFQAVPGEEMRIRTLEGHLIVSSDGETRLLPPGTMLDVPLDEEGNADGPPSEPESYDETEMNLLNVALNTNMLDRRVNVPLPMDEDYLDEFNAYFNQDDSEFFDGDGNDYLFADFFDSYFNGDLTDNTGNADLPEGVDFGSDISGALVEYWASGDVPSEYADEFAQATLEELDPDAQDQFFETLSEQDDPALMEDLGQVYEDVTGSPDGGGGDYTDSGSGDYTDSGSGDYTDGSGDSSGYTDPPPDSGDPPPDDPGSG